MLARTSAAIRKRRQRSRWRDGTIMLPIEVHEHDLSEALIMAGALTPEQTLDRTELKRAAEMVLREWVGRWIKK